jgi:predicted AAA+ superfamily ATPase
MPGYLRRVIDDELDQYFDAASGITLAVVLEGARAVGKTSTVDERAVTRYDLDEEPQLAIVEADVERALAQPAPVAVAEWQRHPPVWDRVRRAADAHDPPRTFLLTSSAAPTGTPDAGRIVATRMRPLSLAERWPGVATVSLRELLEGERPPVDGASPFGLADYTEEILKSGFPGLRARSARARRAQLDGYVDRIIAKEFPALGHHPRTPAALRRWMVAYAAATATAASWEAVRHAAGEPARTTVIPYRDVLERLYVLDPVPGWKSTRIPRLTAQPKHHLADPALATTLLGLDSERLLAGDEPAFPRDVTFLGALFESLVAQSVRVYAQAAGATVSHLRAFAGEREIDLIVERADGRVLAIEVKLRAAPDDKDVAHLKWLREQIGADLLDAVVITTGPQAYRRTDGIAVVPAALLGL